MKTMKFKRIFAFLLVLTLITTTLPPNANAETSGDYTYNTDGITCQITGYTGAGGDITIPASLDGYAVTSFAEYIFADRTDLTGVTIPNSIASIAKGTFANCTNLSSVTIPSGVTIIETYAFDRCSSLTNVTIPDSVWSIGKYAFIDCSSLTSIEIPYGVESISNGAFMRCSNLTEVIIPNSVTRIGENVFERCSNLTEVIIPNSVITLGSSAFLDCIALTDVKIPGSVIYMGVGLFQGCKNLSNVTIESGVTTIDANVFWRCSSLTSITIPLGVTRFAYQAFFGCSNLTDVYFDGGMPSIIELAVFSDCSESLVFHAPTGNPYNISYTPLEEIETKTITVSTENGTITPSVTSGMPGETINLNIIPAKGYCLKPGSLKYNDGSDHIIDRTSFTMPSSDITVFAEFELDTTVPTASLISPSGSSVALSASNIVLGFSETVTAIENKHVTVSDGTNVYTYTIGASDNYFDGIGRMATIPISCFLNGTEPLSLGCDATSYTVVIEGGAYIDDADNPIAASNIGSFSMVKTFTYTINPDHVSCTITGYVSLRRDITIPASLDGYTVTSFAEYVFADCFVLTDVTIPSSVTSVAKGTFANCSNLSSVTIESGATSIGPYAFDRCSSLTGITIPTSVKTIGNYAFKECSSLNSINILNGVTSIGDSAFSYCSKLTEVIIPSSVTSIANNAFIHCSGLNKVAIAGGVTSIGDNALTGCTGLTEISVDEANTHYSSRDGVLYNFDKTALICYPAGLSGAFTIPGSVTSIGNNAFSNCSGLTGVTIPVSVTSIEVSAFSGCINLASVTIPSSITSLGNSAFQYCTALNHTYFDGDMPTMGLSVFDNCSGSLEYHSPSGNPGGITLSPLTTLETKAVTVSPTENGTVSPSTVNGMPGETISLEITPTMGYRLKPGSLKYNDGSDDYSISGTSFTMPDNAITISGVFVEIDNTVPIVNLVSPSGTSVALSAADMVLGFSETVTAVESKSVTISDGTNDYIYTIGTSDGYVSGIGSDCKATIPIQKFLNGMVPLSLGYNTTYTVTLEAGAYIDSEDNETAAGSIGSFKTEAEPITVTSVTVKTQPTQITYTAGDLLDLTGLVVTLHKSNSTTEDVAFADFVAKGITTTPAIGAGLSTTDNAVTITYTADHQSVSQSITVNPAAVTVTSVTVKTQPTQITYTAGDLLDLIGLVVTLHKSNSTTEDVAFADFGTKGITTTPAIGAGLSISDNVVTITYTADNQSVNQNITVNPAVVTVTSVTVKTQPTKITYTAGDLLDLNGLVVTLHKSNSTTEDVASADFAAKGITTTPTNGAGLSTTDSAVTITYTADNQSVSQSITVNPAVVTVTSVTVMTEPTKTTYTAGELLDLSGLVVTLHKSNSTTEDVAFADFVAKGITTTPTNGTGLSTTDSAVTITYTADHQSVSQSITVNPAVVNVTSVTVMTEPTKTTYTAGELLDLSGLVVTLHKSNSTTEDVASADFVAKGITTTPTNGTGLSTTDSAVAITYTADNQLVNQNITVNPAVVTVTSVTVKTQPTQIIYTAGDLLDLTGLVVTLHKSDSTTEDVAFADFGTKGVTTTPANGTGLSDSDSVVTITYTADHQSVNQSITVNPAVVTVTSVTVKTQPTQITYTAGELLDLSGLVVTLHKSNSTTEDVAFADFGTKGVTTTPANGTGLSDSDSVVTITYTADHQSVNQSITVNPAVVTVTSVTVKTQPTKITYTAGDLLDLTGLVVTLHKSNSTTEDVAFADFVAKGITTTPTNGTGLSTTDNAVTITYTADNQSVNQNITVKVVPTITTNALANGVIGTAYSKTLTATGDSPITWRIDSGDLPNGLTLEENTGCISGIPTTSGTFSFTIKAENNEGDDTKALNIYISSASSGNNGGNTGGDSPTPDPEVPITPIATTSSAISFGSLTAGYTTPPIQTVTVKNTGDQSVTLTQPTSEHYVIGALSHSLLNKDETVTFTIQPKPGLVAGSYNESLSIAGTHGASASISLSFTVTEAPVTEVPVTVAYRGHIQNIGDYPLDGSWVKSPEPIGTVGQSKRIEGFEIRLEDAVPAGMELRYNVHVENKGWLYDENNCTDWPKDGTYAGTRGEGLRIEAVKLVLTDKDGQPYPGYSVYYRGHVQNVGDLPTESAAWYTDGEKLGTVGSALRLEALLVKVVKNETDLTAYQALCESIKNQED